MMLALTLVLALAGDERCHVAQVSLVGPLEEVTLELGASRTRLALPLLAGERRTLDVPLGERSLDPDALPTLAQRGAGEVRFDGWLLREDPSAPALLARPAPPLAARGARPTPAALALCAALLMLTLWLWGRRAGALALAFVGMGATFAAGFAAAPGSAPVRVLEGRGDLWLVARAAVSELVLPLGTHPRVACDPVGQPVEWVVRPGGWTVRARGARLVARDPIQVGRRSLAPDLNTWGALDAAWSRSPDGIWSAHGRWELGLPRPPGRTDAGPPGWLAAGLPQGVEVLIARLADGTWSGPAPPPGAQGEVAWLRWVAP